MKTTTRRAIVLAAAGALGLGGIAVAAPALAGAGPFGNRPVAMSEPGPGWRGGGMGMGSGYGMGHGTCPGPAITAVRGTLTEQQKATLAAMAQDEKLARDLYTAFAAKYDAVVFDRIAAAETRHLTAVRTLVTRYGIADPTAGKPAAYDTLLAQGSTSLQAALQVGVTVEQTTIADLTKALDGLTAPDVTQLYTHLRMASQHHLAAFQNG
jgi:hypothetical protein